MAMPAVMIFLEDLKLFAGAITPEDLGTVVLAIASYIETGEEPAGLSPMATVCYNVLKSKADRQKQKYEAKVEAGRKGGSAKGNGKADGKQKETKPTNRNLKPKTETETETETETGTSGGMQGGDAAAAAPAPTAKRFVPPTHDEAWAYAIEHKLGIDVDRFLDYYGSQGWRVGKNPMKDWQAAMNNWARNEREKDAAKAQQNEKRVNAQKVQERDLREEDMKTNGDDEIFREILKMRERGDAS